MIIADRERGNKPPRLVPIQPAMRPGRASSVLKHGDELPRGAKVVLVARVSTRQQEAGHNLEDAVENLVVVARQRGFVVKGVHARCGSGYYPDLSEAVRMAREHDAVLVAESADRIMRNSLYHSSENPDQTLTVEDLRYLKLELRGVPAYTLCHPDTPPREVRGHQTRRGMRAKGNLGGRPCKGRRTFRMRWRPEARRLSNVGLPLRQIAAEITRLSGRRISHTAVSKWLRGRPPAV
jgi:hypothetical protein